jgi:hypothetical protein
VIQINTDRFGPFVVATTVDDNRDVTVSWGFTREGAKRRLFRKLERP